MRKWSKAIAFIMTAALAVGSLSVGPVVQKADAADRIGNYMSWDDDQTTKDIKIPVNPQTFHVLLQICISRSGVHLIHRLKDQVLIIILKIVCNACPHLLILCFYSSKLFICSANIKPSMNCFALFVCTNIICTIMMCINKLNKTFGAAVRSTGSNNAKPYFFSI